MIKTALFSQFAGGNAGGIGAQEKIPASRKKFKLL
jgi:hypothetical protein